MGQERGMAAFEKGLNRKVDRDWLRQQVDQFLLELCGRARTQGHCVTSGLDNGLTLGVDIFDGLVNWAGHIRVHVYNVPREDVVHLNITDVPQAPPLIGQSCTKCAGIPTSYPSWYPGPISTGNRQYYGFQWHTDANDETDLERIKEVVGWLLKHFPPAL